MMVLFRQTQRESIYHPATISDIPPEVLGESLVYFVGYGRRDLVSASLVCRAWYPVAQRSIVSKREFVYEYPGIWRFACGLQTRAIVGADIPSIRYLDIYLERVGKESAMMLAPLVAHSLSTLSIYFYRISSLDCVEVLDAFLNQCNWIRNLRLISFDFGNDPSLISQNINDGFGRLRQLVLFCCRGNLAAFIVQIPIPDIRIFSLYSISTTAENNDILKAAASNYRSLTSIDINVEIESFDCLLKIVESCRDLETLKLISSYSLNLEQDDIKAIASLPRLTSLDINGCVFGDGALSGLSRCRGLRRLSLGNVPGLNDVLPIIGVRLFSLNLGFCDAPTASAIVKHCPNLEYLDLGFDHKMDVDAFVDSCKSGMKRLAKLVVNGKSYRLGTGWKGYNDDESEEDEADKDDE